jgi:hypothetical protein
VNDAPQRLDIELLDRQAAGAVELLAFELELLSLWIRLRRRCATACAQQRRRQAGQDRGQAKYRGDAALKNS